MPGRPATQSSYRLYLRLLGRVRPYWRTFAIAIACMVALAASEPLLPALLHRLLDEGFLDAQPRYRLLVPAALVVLFTARGVLMWGGAVALHWVATRVVMDLREAMFARLLALPAAFYDGARSGELISRLTYDAAQVAQASTRVVTVVVRDSLTIAALLGYLLYLDWMLALIVLALAPVIALAVRRISRRLREMSRRMQHSMGAITSVVDEAIAGRREVRIYGGAEHERGRFHEAANAARRYHMKVIAAAAANTPVIQVVVAAGVAVMIYAATLQAQRGLLSAGEFVAFFTAMTLLLSPIKRLTSVNEHLQRGLAASESIFGLLDTPVERGGGHRPTAPVRGELVFEGVTFRYPGAARPALEDVDLHVAPGETVALVGPSGAGKSTVFALIAGLYRPERGRILLDGRPLEDFDLEALRAQLAVVDQHPVLFNDTIRNNIAYGALRDAPPHRVEAVARAARVDTFAAELPDGLDTVVGDNGVRLSGGQRQRIAIARALLKDAPLLLLDEATSALDTVSERHIQAALEEARAGRTCLVIAHRLSTIEHADRIVVLVDGRVVASGSHAELLAAGGHYAELCRHQFGVAAAAR